MPMPFRGSRNFWAQRSKLLAPHIFQPELCSNVLLCSQNATNLLHGIIWNLFSFESIQMEQSTEAWQGINFTRAAKTWEPNSDAGWSKAPTDESQGSARLHHMRFSILWACQALAEWQDFSNVYSNLNYYRLKPPFQLAGSSPLFTYIKPFCFYRKEKPIKEQNSCWLNKLTNKKEAAYANKGIAGIATEIMATQQPTAQLVNIRWSWVTIRCSLIESL